MNFTEFYKCPVSFILKFSTFNLDGKITTTLLRSRRNTQQ